MILYNKEEIKLMVQNVIVLQCDGSGASIYVSQDVYKQAVLVGARFEDEIGIILSELGIERSNVINFFYENAPEPINILAPFLGLVDSKIKLQNDLEESCAILHKLSMSIDFNLFLLVPAEVRNGVRITANMIKDAKGAWEDAKLKLHIAEIDTNAITTQFVQDLLSKVVSAPVEKSIPSYDNVPEEEEVDPFALLSQLMQEEEVKSKESVISVQTSESTPIFEGEVQEAVTERKAIDKLLGVYRKKGE